MPAAIIITESEMPPHLSRLIDGAEEFDSVPFTAESLRAACEADNIRLVFNNERTEAVAGGKWWVEIDENYPSVKEVGEWIYDVSEHEITEWGLDYDDFNQTFWTHPQELYHATPDDNVEAILANGIGAMNKTRGLSNRGVGAAVFTSSDPEELMHGSYGDSIFQIDTAAMAADGYRPRVEQEPDVEEYEWRRRLLHAVGDEYVCDRMSVPSYMSPYTVIVHGEIPAKYIALTH